MDDLFSREGVASIIADILDRAEDAVAENDGSDFYHGRMEGFYEVLDMMKSRIVVREGNPDDFGIGFQLETLEKEMEKRRKAKK